ncbi:MAG: SDR family NAD(P)-dependent oxidoreductase [Bdellovibrionota bacterium]
MTSKAIFSFLPPGQFFERDAHALAAEGALPVVDLAYLSRDERASLIRSLPRNLELGFTLAPDLIADELAGLRVAALVVPLDWELDEAVDLGAFLANFRGKSVWVEASSLPSAAKAEQAGATGIILKGFESGGVTGEESAFILLQRYEGKLPVLVRGGIGPDTAAACVAAGAAGVVLDVQTWGALALDTEVRQALHSLQGTDSVYLRLTDRHVLRVTGKMGAKAMRELRAAEEQVLVAAAGEKTPESERARTERAEALYRELQKISVSAFRPGTGKVFPVGQEAGWAKLYSEKFGSAAGIVRAVRETMESSPRAALQDFPWRENSDFAKSVGSRYPIFQGPMAQTSDVPAFAEKLMEEGCVANIALGNMPGDVCKKLLEETSVLAKGRPFGGGIIGLEANAFFRDQHIAHLKNIRPPLAVVAAGTTEQALDLAHAGVRSFLHTPVHTLLVSAMDQGHTDFILEGTEAGGHIGKLTSFVLWQSVIQALVDRPAAGGLKAYVVLAGGFGNAKGATAAAALCARAKKAGHAFGIQMGTAFLFTKEAVETGAASSTFQQVVIDLDRTETIGDTVMTPARMAPTAKLFNIREQEYLRLKKGDSLENRKHAYEGDNLGGLRAAAKAQRIEKKPEGGVRFVQISREQQYEQGLFHVGMCAALRRSQTTIAEVVADNTARAEALLRQNLETSVPVQSPVQIPSAQIQQASVPANGHAEADTAIAIVGLGGLFPDAQDIPSYWKNIVAGKYSIREVPESRWPTKLYYSSDRAAPDKSYSKIGGFLEEPEFDSKSFKIPPTVAVTMDSVQKVTLLAVREALRDAGYYQAKEFDKTRCAVILGNSMGGEVSHKYSYRLALPRIIEQLEKTPGWQKLPSEERKQILDQVAKDYLSQLPEITGGSMPGELANVISGRVASVFDLSGPNYVCDAACAASMAALQTAVRGLLAGDFDMAVTGGVDRGMDADSYIKFCKVGALSSEMSCPFDQRASGFVMGEGVGILILKRLADAERDGDKVYAVLRGMGSSSDGAGRGITAPSPTGQRKAIERAYKMAGVEPSTVTLVECHGTSTPLGDATETSVLRDWMNEHGAKPHSIAVGSVKSQIGHLKAAAGAAGLIKTVLALHNKTLPPTINFESPASGTGLGEGSPLYANTAARPWSPPEGTPRRAAVSAFGFGGTNFHALLEEFGATGRSSKNFKGTNGGGNGVHYAAAVAATPASAPVIQAQATPAASVDTSAIEKKVIATLAEQTGYDPADLGRTLDLEADLGIDTVKQAEVFALLRESFQLEKDPNLKLRDYPTIEKIVGYLAGRLSGSVTVSAPVAQAAAPQVAEPAVEAAKPAPAAVDRGEIEKKITATLAEQTGYDAADLGRTLDLEADLGIDTVKQAEVFAILRESFKLEKDPNLKLRDYPTIEKIADYLAMRLSSGTAPAAAAPSAQPVAAKVEAKPVATDGPGYVAVRGKDAQDLAANLAVWAASPSGHSFGSGSKIAAFGFLTKAEGAKKAQAAAEAIRAGKKPAPPLNVRLTEARKNKAKVAFVYPGQGSQYVGMLQELLAFPEVRETFEEAERIVSPLIGKSLLSIIHPTDKSPENLARCEEELRQTEITQPAVLAADVAIHRFLVARGFSPDAVAGHSLGEYGACVAAGVLTFAQALEAVAARGREMAHVQVPDKGLMLSVPMGSQDVEPLLKDIPGYIAVANRNSPGQTVIGGETAAVQELKRRLEEKGVEGILLNVSHAFHSKIVAPASVPLRKVLERLGPKAPVLPLYSNVTAEPYPTGSGANAQIVDLLSKQIAASVDWIGTCQNFNRDGFEVFVECGPKRALAGLVESNLKGRPCAALQTCHPKRGELLSLMEALAHLSAETAVEDVSVRPAPAALANAVPVAAPAGILSKWVSDPRFSSFWAKHGGAIEGLVSHLWNLEAGSAPAVRMESRPAAQAPNALWAAATPVLRRVPSYKKSEIAEGRFLSGKSVAVLSLGGPAGLAQELASRGARTGASLKDADVIVVDARAMENSPDLSAAISQKLEALVEIAKSSREDAVIVGLGGVGGSFAAELLGVSVRGFLLSLSHERSQMRLRWVDAAPDFTDLAKAIDAECALDGLVVQSRWTKAGREVLSVLDAQAPAGQGLSPRADRVWLVTGGARGITREIVLDLAKNLGGKFALVGSSPEPTGTVQLLDETSLRKEIRAEAKSRGAAIAAGEVEAEVRRRLAAADIQKALEALRAAGCEGRYYACDLSDEKSIGNLLSRVRKDFGALNVVIHGAGREMSHATAEKTGKEIRETLAPKLGGALALARGTKGDSIEAFVLFGSVVGRLGNRGQADYAAANLSLSVLASRFSEIGNASAKALLLDWSAWADVGMASRGVAKQFFKEAGVDVIQPATGAPLVRAELLAGTSGEVLVCGSLGDLDRAGVLARVEQVASSGAAAVTVEAEPWLVDHSISGVPVLPGVAGIELLRRSAGFSGKAFEGRGIRFERAIKVFAGKGATLRASASAVECEGQTPQGKEFKTHFTAQGFSSLGEQAGSLNREIPGTDARTRTGIYKAYFHGPLFQVMTGGLDARSSEWFFTAKAADFFRNGKLLSGAGADASAIEAAFQAAGLRLLIEHGESALPSGIAKLSVFRKIQDGEKLTIAVAPLSKEGNWRCDVRVYGQDGAEAVRLTGYEQVVTGQNVSLPEELRGGGKSAPAPAAAPKAPVAASPVNVDRGEVLGRILEVLCRETGYEASDINPDSDLEADLGIDTVKQAEVFAHVRTSYNLEKDQNFKLRDYPTLNRLADYVVMRLSGAAAAAAPAPEAVREERKVETAEEKLLKADHIGLPSPPLGEGWARFAAVNALDVQARLDRDPAGVLGILSPEERAEYQAFEYQKRKDEWLAGRLASRQALKAFGIDAPVHVTHDESGEPKFVGDLGERFGLTISHSHIWACAVVFERTGPIGEHRVLGLDVERIEQRPAAFLEDHFTDEERRWVTSGGADAPFRATVLWSLKESALKALGTGLRLRPADVAVQVLGANGHGEARVQLTGEAQARQRSLGLAEFEGRYTRDAEFVVTVVETARVPSISSENLRRGSGWTIGFRPAGKTQAD